MALHRAASSVTPVAQQPDSRPGFNAPHATRHRRPEIARATLLHSLSSLRRPTPIVSAPCSSAPPASRRLDVGRHARRQAGAARPDLGDPPRCAPSSRNTGCLPLLRLMHCRGVPVRNGAKTFFRRRSGAVDDARVNDRPRCAADRPRDASRSCGHRLARGFLRLRARAFDGGEGHAAVRSPKRGAGSAAGWPQHRDAHVGQSAMRGALERNSTWSGRSPAKTRQAAASASVSKVPSSNPVSNSITVICGSPTGAP